MQSDATVERRDAIVARREVTIARRDTDAKPEAWWGR